uniref:Protein kinase domain-containing protein n=1 Tax=Lactuca sativa TaxID=4236 RepID=A0A9R1X018_LACSA|nr:hypothetical protein LSAT_V11C800407030 [Lactuca sativa]
MSDKHTNELVAIKYIERGEKASVKNRFEIESCYLKLKHGFISLTLQVILTPTRLIVMEYASGGELFERICNVGRSLINSYRQGCCVNE